MTDYRAQDNAPFIWDGVNLGELKSLSLQGFTVEMIENTSKDGTLVKSYRAGLTEPGTWNIGVALDPADTVQAKFLNELTGSSAAASTSGHGYRMIISGSTTQSRVAIGSASVTTFDIDSPEGSSLITANVTLQNLIAPVFTASIW